MWYLDHHEEDREVFACLRVVEEGVVFDPERSDKESHYYEILEAEESFVHYL